MFKTILSLVVFAATLLTSTSAWAVKISVVGVGDLTTQRDNMPPSTPPGSHSNKSSPGYGAGALIEFPVTMGFSFEFGGLYYKRMSKLEQNVQGILDGSGTLVCLSGTAECTLTTTYETKALEIPVTAKIWLNRYLNIGVGAYYIKYIGDLVSTQKAFDPSDTEIGSRTRTVAFSDSSVNSESFDYGAQVSLGLNLPIGQNVAFRVDGRYKRGLADATKDNNLEGNGFVRKFDSLQAFVGLTFGGMK